MKKIPTLFMRQFEVTKSPTKHPLVTDQVRPGCEWVLEGKGIATRMWDGWCCLVKGGRLWRQRFYQFPPHQNPKLALKEPKGIIDLHLDPVDEHHKPNLWWWPVTDAPEDKWHREAHEELRFSYWDPDEPQKKIEIPEGTYELCGPEINSNPEGFDKHVLVQHDNWDDWGPDYFYQSTSFNLIKRALIDNPMKGLVFYHQDDNRLPHHERRMAKIKRTDFGLEWPIKMKERKRVRIGKSDVYVIIGDDDSISIKDGDGCDEDRIDLDEKEMRDLSKVLNDLKSGNL